MIFTVLSWLVARVLDGLGASASFPEMAATLGIVLLVLGTAALVWIVVRSIRQRRTGRHTPVGSLTETRPWLVEQPTVPDPVWMRRTHRHPVARHVPAPQRKPGLSAQEWPTIVLPPAESETTVVVPRVYGGDR